MKKILIVLLFISVNISTSFTQEKEFVLNGMIGGIQDESIFLYQDTGEGMVLIDSTQTKNGEFQFSGKTTGAFAAQLRLSDKSRAKFFISPSKMNLLVHKDKFKYRFLIKKLTGSDAQDRYEDFQIQLQNVNKKKLKIASDLEIPEVTNDPIKKKSLLDEYKKLSQFQKEYYLKYASSPVIPYLIYKDYFGGKCHLDDIKEYLTTLNQANPNGIYVKNLNKRVQTIDSIYEKNLFPNIIAKTINGKVFNLDESEKSFKLIYIWRAWLPERNEKQYQSLTEIHSKINKSNISLVSIIRNSSFNRIRIKGTNKGELWRPKIDPNNTYIEIESLDKSVGMIKYLDRKFHAFLVNQDGEILYHQDFIDTNLLISEVNKHVSNP